MIFALGYPIQRTADAILLTVLLQQNGQSRDTRGRSVLKLAGLNAEQYHPVLDLSHQLAPRGQEPQAALDRISKR